MPHVLGKTCQLQYTMYSRRDVWGSGGLQGVDWVGAEGLKGSTKPWGNTGVDWSITGVDWGITGVN